MCKVLICVFLVYAGCAAAWELDSTPEVYSAVNDIHKPELADYYAIQNYITFGDRPKLQRLFCKHRNKDNYVKIAKAFKIIGNNEAEHPRSALIAVNCDEAQRENCIVLYASFNKKYPEGLTRLIEAIQSSDYVGHVLYYYGGWPNVEGGDLVLAHVPYAFKACLFKEAGRLGFKRALWLDSATIPIVSLNTIFEMIQTKGYFIVGNTHAIEPVFNATAASAFQITLKETRYVPSCCTAQVGIDFTNPIGERIVDLWHLAARDKDAYYSSLPEQSALSIILHQLNINDFISYNTIVDTRKKRSIRPDSLFVLDKRFVHGLGAPFQFPVSNTQ